MRCRSGAGLEWARDIAVVICDGTIPILIIILQDISCPVTNIHFRSHSSVAFRNPLRRVLSDLLSL